jgi:hypothetical protein
MNFKGFQRIGTKNGKTTFKHPAGHYISVAHSGLSKEHRTAIEALANGGQVPQTSPQPPVTPQGISDGFKKATGIKMMKDGGNTVDGVEADPANVSDHVVTPVERMGLPADTVGNELSQSLSNADAPAQLGTVPDAPPTPATVPQDPAAAAAGLDQPVQADPSAPAQNRSPASAPQAAPAQQGPPAIKGFLGDQATKFEDDLNKGHIQAKTYSDLFDKKDTLGKIGTIFGLLVGSAGAGLSHQPNALMEMMNNEIQRDLESQKTSAANRQNWLKMVQQNPLIDAQVKNLGANTQATKFALAQSMMTQATFHDLASKLDRMPRSTPAQEAAYQAKKQAAMAVYNFLGAKVNSAMDAAAVMKPDQDIETPGQGDGGGILRPGASLKGNQAVLPEERAKFNEELTQAQQAEKGLSGIKEAMQDQRKALQGVGSYVQRGAQLAHNLDKLPFHIGDIASGPIQAASDLFGKNREYDSAQSRLEGHLATALPETTESERKEIARKNAVVKGDSDELVAKKTRAIEDFIISKQKTGMLEKYHMLGQRAQQYKKQDKN